MISFSNNDIIIILSFFLLVLMAGFIPSFRKKNSSGSEDYLLSGRNVGLFLFVLTNVSTWYGGILGVGEFTYSYGIFSWFTQGLPYYIFAILFAWFFAKKIRMASLFTIPDKLEEVYGKPAAIIGAIFLFMLLSPAPYLLMTGNLIDMVFNTGIFTGLIVGAVLSAIYLFSGGYRSDLYTDAVEFFVMFIGFIIIFVWAYFKIGDFSYLAGALPPSHLTLTGGNTFGYIIVWFLIALWTFTDPGFHQRCYAAQSGDVAKKGILISILFWALFDFLTTSVGLYARALLPGIEKPVMSYPLLAEKILPSGAKGIFYAGMFATILSTLNSFMFLSATTFSRDFIFKLKRKNEKVQLQDGILKKYTIIGLIFAGLVSIIMAYYIPSVINLWYTVGTIFIPGLILPVTGAYYSRLRISPAWTLAEITISFITALSWFILRMQYPQVFLLGLIEPMLAGFGIAILIHVSGMIFKQERYKVF